MKKKILNSRSLLLAGLIIISGTFSLLSPCTGVFFGNQKLALVGNNEDWMSPFTRIWFVPAKPGQFGQVFFGFQEGGYQGGMNDQGLFFDGFALKPLELVPQPGKEIYPGNLALKVMNECRTVKEAITLFERYDRSDLAGAQLFFADRTGDSAIIEARTIIRKAGPWQLVTNFRQSETSPQTTTDSRYCIARQMIDEKKEIDADPFRHIRQIMAATHQEGKYPTQYTNICDLKNGKILLYRFHNYEQPVFIDLTEELNKGERVIDMNTLFPDAHAFMVYRTEIEKTMKQRMTALSIIPQNATTAGLWTGEYAFPDGMLAGYTLSIRYQDKALYATISSLLESALMQALSDTEYVVNGLEEIYRFSFSPQTEEDPVKLKVIMMGMEAVAVRKK